MEEENKTIWENANEILADYIINPEDGSWVKKNYRNKETIVIVVNMDDQSEQDTSFGLKEQDKEFIDKELRRKS